jgi:adenylosuccinate lyase
MTLDKNKYETSNNLLAEFISEDVLLINPLILSEYIFVLSKLKIDENVIEQGINQFKDFVYSEISKVQY